MSPIGASPAWNVRFASSSRLPLWQSPLETHRVSSRRGPPLPDRILLVSLPGPTPGAAPPPTARGARLGKPPPTADRCATRKRSGSCLFSAASTRYGEFSTFPQAIIVWVTRINNGWSVFMRRFRRFGRSLCVITFSERRLSTSRGRSGANMRSSRKWVLQKQRPDRS